MRLSHLKVAFMYLTGEVFMFSLGNTQIVHVTQPEMVREITTCTSLDLGKPTYQVKERGSLLGNGILTSNGPFWAHQRKILAPELYMDKVKVKNFDFMGSHQVKLFFTRKIHDLSQILYICGFHVGYDKFSAGFCINIVEFME